MSDIQLRWVEREVSVPMNPHFYGEQMACIKKQRTLQYRTSNNNSLLWSNWKDVPAVMKPKEGSGDE